MKKDRKVIISISLPITKLDILDKCGLTQSRLVSDYITYSITESNIKKYLKERR